MILCILAAILDYGRHIDLRQNLRWPRSIFEIVWPKVYESTDKTLTGKRAVFTWFGPVYYMEFEYNAGGLLVATIASTIRTITDWTIRSVARMTITINALTARDY